MTSIAIVIASYNGASTLQATLDSIAEQKVMPDEVIVMDGGSTDGTVDILKSQDELFSHWESAPDKGLYHAWNKALEHVKSDWVWFIGCDDRLAGAQVIEQWKQRLEGENSQTGLVYSRVAMVGTSGRVNEVHGKPWNPRRNMHFGMSFPFTGTAIRRAVFDKVGAFSTQFRIAGDFDWSLRALEVCDIAFYDSLTVYAGDVGLSGATKTQVACIKEAGEILEKHGRGKSRDWYLLLWKVQTKHWLDKNLGPDVQRWAVDLYRICTGRKPRLTAR